MERREPVTVVSIFGHTAAFGHDPRNVHGARAAECLDELRGVLEGVVHSGLQSILHERHHYQAQSKKPSLVCSSAQRDLGEVRIHTFGQRRTQCAAQPVEGSGSPWYLRYLCTGFRDASLGVLRQHVQAGSQRRSLLRSSQ